MVTPRPVAGRREGGFTLAELVMVLVIAGVLAAFAVPRFFDRASADARGYLGETLAAVRHAHKLAIASGCDVQVSLGAGGYALARRAACTGGAFSQPVAHPTRAGAFAASVPAGVAVAGGATFHFDTFGRPRGAGGALIAGAIDFGIGAETLRVEPQTGFTHRP